MPCLEILPSRKIITCYDPTPLGWEVFKANLFSKYEEKRYEEKLEKLEKKIKLEPNDENRHLIIRTYVGIQHLQQILKENTSNIYYNWKNAVYREENYFKELMDIQQRIDFIRAIGMGSAFMVIFLFIVIIFWILCSDINIDFPKLLSGLFRWLNPSRRFRYEKNEKKNYVLAGKIIWRSFLLLILIFIFHLITSKIYRHEEIQFNKRIFGNFIKLDSLQKNEQMQIINVNNN